MTIFKPYLNPMTPFKEQELIKYMNKRLLEEKAITFSDIRNRLRVKYNVLDDNQLSEEKDSISLRKVALENAAIENTSSIALSALAVLFSIAALLDRVIPTVISNLGESIFGLIRLIIIYPLSLIGFILFYEHLVILRAKEIAYCTLALDIIEKIQSERIAT